MKKIVVLLLLLPCLCMAQHAKNNSANSIVGLYQVSHGGEKSKVRVTRAQDGSYTAVCIWLQDSLDAKTGKLRTDIKNPDKSLRSTPCNRVVIFKGIRYDAKKKAWNGGKVYDPTRGLNANCSCEFDKSGKLKVRGSLMGISETLIWTPLG